MIARALSAAVGSAYSWVVSTRLWPAISATRKASVLARTRRVTNVWRSVWAVSPSTPQMTSTAACSSTGSSAEFTAATLATHRNPRVGPLVASECVAKGGQEPGWRSTRNRGRGRDLLMSEVLGLGWPGAFPVPARFLRRRQGSVALFYRDLAWCRHFSPSGTDFLVFAGAVRLLAWFLCSHCSTLLVWFRNVPSRFGLARPGSQQRSRRPAS